LADLIGERAGELCRPSTACALAHTDDGLAAEVIGNVRRRLKNLVLCSAAFGLWDKVLHGEESSVWADKGYVSVKREAAFVAVGGAWGVMRKAPMGGKLHPEHEKINRIIAMVRARVEHPFRVLKRQFGYVKTRYRGLAKNRAQLFTLFALGNLFLVRRRLMA
ncbi:transposase, partial [Rhodovulum sulfidophilum]|uniref:transposase n=1 Tax=Rhodovulum sulfidophilum TaxID=35806 RepID=UPI001EED376E